jgi:hypothetical protein
VRDPRTAPHDDQTWRPKPLTSKDDINGRPLQQRRTHPAMPKCHPREHSQTPDHFLNEPYKRAVNMKTIVTVPVVDTVTVIFRQDHLPPWSSLRRPESRPPAVRAADDLPLLMIERC